MTEQLLRNAVKEAQEKEQLGLLIWANWTVWDDLAFDMKQGNGHYDFALSQISKGEEATIQTKWNGLSMPGIIAVSMQKLSSSNEFFAYVLSMCKEGHYKGPITLIPSNEVIDFR